MRRLNISFALILILSASLLSDARNASGESPRATPKPVPLASESKEQPTSDEQRAQNAPSVLNEEQSADQSKTPTGTNTPAYDYERISGESAVAQVVFAFFVTIFTGILGVVAVQQWRGYRNLERGVVVVDEIELTNFLPESKLKPDQSLYISFRFRNIGRTPLRLIESKIQFHLAIELIEPPDYGNHAINMKGQVLAQDEYLFRFYPLYDPRVPSARLPDVTYDMVSSTSDLFLVFYGYLRYIDAFGVRHIRGFGFQYSALAAIISKRSQFQVYGSDAYNYERKEKRGWPRNEAR